MSFQVIIHNTVIQDKTPGNDTTIKFHLAPPITLISLDNVTFTNTQKLSFQYKDMTHDQLIQKIKTHGNKCKDAEPCIIQTCDALTCNEIHQFSVSKSIIAETSFSSSHSTSAETVINNTPWIALILISFLTKCCYY